MRWLFNYLKAKRRTKTVSWLTERFNGALAITYRIEKTIQCFPRRVIEEKVTARVFDFTGLLPNNEVTSVTRTGIFEELSRNNGVVFIANEFGITVLRKGEIM